VQQEDIISTYTLPHHIDKYKMLLNLFKHTKKKSIGIGTCTSEPVHLNVVTFVVVF